MLGPVVIPCGASKRPHPAPAGELYVGSYFRACRDWALSVAPAGQVVILSAKHGFVRLDEVIEPYDVRFGMQGEVDLGALAAGARKLHLAGALVLGGEEYRRRALAVIPDAIAWLDLVREELPAAGMGHQIGWLRRHLGRRPGALPPVGAPALSPRGTPPLVLRNGFQAAEVCTSTKAVTGRQS